MFLIYFFEVERKLFELEEVDERIRSLEELLRKINYDEEFMKIWIRCVRFGFKLLSLKLVWSKIDRWLKIIGRRLLNVLFYK